jgi:hypothetical protein
MAKPDHITQACWDTCMERLENAPKEWGRHLAAGGYINDKGEILSGRWNSSPNWKGTVCHGFIQESDMFKDSMVFFNTQTVDPLGNGKSDSGGYLRKDGNAEANEAFTKWMCEESPWRDYILNDDWHQVMEGGAIIDTQACGSNNLLTICKLLRTKYEDTFRVPIWYNLVQKGVHPMIALIYSNNTNSNQNAYSHTHNSSLYVPTTPQQMELLFQDKIPKCDKGWDCKEVLGGGSSVGLIPTKAAAPKKIKKPDGWGGYIETTEAGDPSELIETLKKLEKEYRK